jgi:hypothetical protein
MKKIVRLTESYLVRLVRRVINENSYDKKEVDEQLIKNLIQKVINPRTIKKPLAKQTAKQTIPAASRVPNDVQNLIKSLPQSVKVSDKLAQLFKSHSGSLKSLEGNISRQLANNPKFGMADLYAKKLVNYSKTPAGQNINLQGMLSDAHLLKIHLDDLVKANLKPKEGGLLNKNKNINNQLETWYNYLYLEKGSLNRFIDDLTKILPKK